MEFNHHIKCGISISIIITFRIIFIYKTVVQLNDQAAPQMQHDNSETISLFGSYKEMRPQSASPSKVLEELEEYLKKPKLALTKEESL